MDWLRKRLACFGLLCCDEDSGCPFVEACMQECWSHPERMAEAIRLACLRRGRRSEWSEW